MMATVMTMILVIMMTMMTDRNHRPKSCGELKKTERHIRARESYLGTCELCTGHGPKFCPVVPKTFEKAGQIVAPAGITHATHLRWSCALILCSYGFAATEQVGTLSLASDAGPCLKSRAISFPFHWSAIMNSVRAAAPPVELGSPSAARSRWAGCGASPGIAFGSAGIR